MIVPAYPIPEIRQVETIFHLASFKYVCGISRPISFDDIQAFISKDCPRLFSREAIARTWAPVYNELAIDYNQITGNDIEILCVIRGALEDEGLLNIIFSMESLGVSMPNESTELHCHLLPTSQPRTFSLLVHLVGECSQLMSKSGHAVTLSNSGDPSNSPVSSSYELVRMPCGGNNMVYNFASCNITFPSDPVGQDIDIDFTFLDEWGEGHFTSRALTV